MKRAILILLVLVMVLSVVGCAGSKPVEAATQAAPAAEAAPATAEEREPVTITYMRQEHRDATAELEIIAEFEKEYPWITIEVINAPSGETYNKFLLADQAGKPIDLAWTFWVGGAASNGLFEDLTNYASEEYLATFDEAMLGIGSFDGTLYAIPWRAGANIYIANVDVLEQAGYTLAEIQDGWTWDEFRTYAEKAREIGGDVYGVGFCGSSADAGTDYQFWPWLLTAGGSLFDESGTRAGFNTPEGVKALTFLCDLVKDGLVPPGVASTGSSILQELQAADQLGMWQDGPWKLVTIRNSYPDKNFAAVPLPTLDGKVGNISGGTAIGMSSHSAHKEEAWLFLSYLTNEENLLKMCKSLNELSPIVSNWDDEFYASADWQVIIDALRKCDNIYPSNSYYDSNTLNQIMRDYLTAAFVGDITPEEALASAAEEWDALLSEYYG